MKKAIMIAAALMMFAATAKAQVFILDDDEFAGNRASSTMGVPNPQIYDSGEDWFVPAGEGIFVLAGLAGAYLLGKRKKEQE